MAASGVVVLAEDDAKLRRLYSDALSAAGYYVMAASDGAEALNLLGTVSPKIILLDIMMPNMNGIETCKRARGIVGDQVPIIFMSALDQIDTLKECLAAGGDDYIIKSNSLKTMLERIGHWARQPARKQLSERRASALNDVETAVDTKANAKGTKNETLSSENDRTVREISDFIALARKSAMEGFGGTIEQKLYLLGYVAGAVEHWAKKHDGLGQRFNDYLGAVMRETKILTDQEVADLMLAFDELSADMQFGMARAHGRHDPLEYDRKGADYSPLGLSQFTAKA